MGLFGNKTKKMSPEKLQAELNVLEEDKQKSMEEFDKKRADIQEQLLKKEKATQAPTVEQKQPADQKETGDLSSVLKRFDDLNDIIETLREEFQAGNQGDKISSQLAEIDRKQTGMLADMRENFQQDEIIRKQNDQIQKLQNDLYKKIQLPLINRIIQIADFGRQILKSLDNIEKDKQPDYLKEQLEKYIDSTDAVLRDNGVEKFSEFEKGNKQLDLEKQQLQGVIPTTEKGKDDLVAETTQPGYVWLLPDTSSSTTNRRPFVIRPEIVKIYEYKEY